MTILKIIEKIAAMPNGAILTTENRHSQPYLISVANTYRGELARQIFDKTKMIHSEYYQKFYCEFVRELQDSVLAVKFSCPPSISVDGKTDGFRFVGEESCSISFTRTMTRGQLSNFNNHKIMSIAVHKFPSVFYDSTDKVWEVYGKKDLRKLMIEGIIGDPTLIPRYNIEIDHYPIPENDIALLEELIYSKNTSISSQTYPDYVPNGIDDSGVQQPNRRRK